MTDCKATIEVGGETLTCCETVAYHNAHPDSRHALPAIEERGRFRAPLTWTDDVPGATPHVDHVPRWRADIRGGGAWWIVTDEGRIAARFSRAHPDMEGAAKAEAARLNGELSSVCGVALSRERRFREALTTIADYPPTSPSLFARRVLDGVQS